ncbi:MAG TPA: Uma2 family endonuclease [Gemmatimonadales bacterium]|nr:Uma2 family endonuclease [Gemmatimonadales bacterium]
MNREHPVGPMMTLDHYLAFEERSPFKHEYVGGEVYAMSGVTTRHNLITLNIATYLRAAARARRCKVFATDVKVRAADRVYYPDVMVACGKAANVDLIVEAPTLVVEVTSPSTRATDRREKLDTYRRIPSLRVYLIVDQRRKYVLAYRRGPRGEWTRQEFSGEGRIALGALNTRITLDQIYEGVDLPPLAVGEDQPDWGDYEEGAEL